MKNFKLSCFASLLLIANSLLAQDFKPASTVFHANEIRTLIAAGGNMFWDGIGNGDYLVPYQDENSPGTIFTGNLWFGTMDNGELRIAAQTYGGYYDYPDFYPGPLDPATGLPFSAEDVKQFNKVWTVERYEIEQHIADYEDNLTIDNPNFAVIGWPGNKNPYFASVNGFKMPEMPDGAAPFFDRNGDGIYNPFQGDYPLPEGVSAKEIPEQIVWQVYNDAAGPHGETNGLPLSFEIQQTTWAFRCYDNPLLNQTLFVSQKIINRSGKDYSNVYVGQWSDLNIGCHQDDYLGSAPSLNAFFAYNATPDDKLNCSGMPSYGAYPPAQAVTFLNQEMKGFGQYFNGGFQNPPPAMTDPASAKEFYHYLTGKWKDGIPLTFGGNGYQMGGGGTAVQFAFPDNPNDPNGWSQYAENLPAFDSRQLGILLFDSFKNGEVKKIDVAFSTHFDPKLDHVGQVSLIYEDIPKIKNWYATGFDGVCTQPDCNGDCIWPGDANNDGIANHYDLLAIGQGLGQEGPYRYSSKVWAPQSGGDWLQSLSDGLNYKHLDTDGNGKIETADFNLTKLHYGKFRTEYLRPKSELEGDDFYITTSKVLEDGILDRGEGYFSLYINKIASDSLVGMGFTLEFDTNYFEDYQFVQTKFPDYPNYAAVQLNQTQRMTGNLDFAVLKDDGSTITENEAFLKFIQIRPKSELPGTSTKFHFHDIRGLLKNGKEVQFGGKDLTINFTGFDIVEKTEPTHLKIFPNPSDGVFYFQLDQEEVSNIKVYDSTGRLMSVQPKAHQRDFMLDLSGYSAGVYFLKTATSQGVQTSILVKSK